MKFNPKIGQLSSELQNEITLWSNWLGVEFDEDPLGFSQAIINETVLSAANFQEKTLDALERFFRCNKTLFTEQISDFVLDLFTGNFTSEMEKRAFFTRYLQHELAISRNNLLPVIEEILKTTATFTTEFVQKLNRIIDKRMEEEEDSAYKDLKTCAYLIENDSYCLKGAQRISDCLQKEFRIYEIELLENLRIVARKSLVTSLKILVVSGGASQKLSDQQCQTIRNLLGNRQKLIKRATFSEMKTALRALGLIDTPKGKHDKVVIFDKPVKDFLLHLIKGEYR